LDYVKVRRDCTPSLKFVFWGKYSCIMQLHHHGRICSPRKTDLMQMQCYGTDNRVCKYRCWNTPCNTSSKCSLIPPVGSHFSSPAWLDFSEQCELLQLCVTFLLPKPLTPCYMVKYLSRELS
jgi:hypothetical protein